MPYPEGAGLTGGFSPRLTNMAMGYLPQMSMFVGSRIFPSVAVGAESGSYNILPREEFLRPQGKRLANGEAPPVGGFKFATDVYSVYEYGLSAQITQRDLNNAAVGGLGAGRLRNMKTQFVTFQAALAMELDISAIVTTAGNWATSYGGVTATPNGTQFIQWDQAASDPVGNVNKWREQMRLATGFEPNKMMFTRPVLNALKTNPEIIDRIKYMGTSSNPAKVTTQTLAELFELDEIIVPTAVSNTAQEGATATIADIWGKNIFLWYTPGAPSMELPSAGYRFSWTGDVHSEGVGPQPFGGSANAEGLFIRNYITDRPAVEWVESRWYTVPKVTGSSLGILCTAAVS